jgi:Holliday junction resolvase-like predicted endonuclease
MYPPEFLGGYGFTPEGKEAEKIVYNVLSKVDEVMFIMHSKCFCVNKVGQIDFLICNQDRGIILLEVKSGRKLKDYNKAEKQLEKAATAIKTKVKKIKTGKGKSASVRYAVVMPNVSRHDHSPTHVEGCYKEDLASKEEFQSWLDEYMQILDDGQKLTNEKYDKCLSTFLPIDKVNNDLMRLTPKQAEMLEPLSEEAYITGPAE